MCSISPAPQPAEGRHDVDVIRWGHAGPGIPLADQLRLSHICLTMLTGDTLMTVGFLIMMVVPLYEMWVLNQPLMAGNTEEKNELDVPCRSTQICGQRFLTQSPRSYGMILGSVFFWRSNDATTSL